MMTVLPVIDVGKISEPITKLVEAVSSAVGVLYEPTRVRRLAEAQADAAIVLAKGKHEISELEYRAARRLAHRETRRQHNIEAITEKAIAALPAEVSKTPADPDWIVRFFAECEDVSNDQMQKLWAKILAGEITAPGAFSLRTLSIVRSMTKDDATVLSKLATCVWILDKDPIPMIHDSSLPTLEQYGVTFLQLLHLQSLGLISFEPATGFTFEPDQPGILLADYFGASYSVKLAEGKSHLSISRILATTSAKELFTICSAKPDERIRCAVLQHFES